MARKIRFLKVNQEFVVETAQARASALRSWKELFRSGVVEFQLKTWVNNDESYTIRAVK